MTHCSECSGWLHYKYTHLPIYKFLMLVTSSWNFTCLSCVILSNDVPLLYIDSEFERLASTNRKLEKEIMDLQREKSELIDSNGQKVSRLQTQLQE